ncbi:hypothetical protein CHS0354_029744 [Potamilus streckersoni]|uniref:THD domain-containing protein n=1 Tax=Potamilus streckersoni TaxID=2493646 RepID=A0AAE0TH32_9BIVA|nr:hypothetical protein CHS0354_029744 [Potamilus streckersoni]
MNVTDIQRQESESDVFDVEKDDGKRYKMKRRNYCIYSIIIQSFVTVITVVLVMIIDRKLIPQWSPPLINSSAAETSTYQMSKTEFVALEDIQRENRGSAHLFYYPNKTCGDASYCVMWIDPDKLDSFVSEGIIFHRNNGSLQVKEPGIYQVYSKLTLKYNGISTEKQLIRDSYSTLQKNGKQLTIERFRFPLSGESTIQEQAWYHKILVLYQLQNSITLSHVQDNLDGYHV